MQVFAYPAVIEPGAVSGFVVSFPDVPEAITEGVDQAEARSMGAEALALALRAYIDGGRPLPPPSLAHENTISISVAPEDAAKLAVLQAFRDSGLTKSELARQLGRDEREIRRVLDPMHATKLPALTAALAALGRRLVVGVEELDAARPATRGRQKQKARIRPLPDAA